MQIPIRACGGGKGHRLVDNWRSAGVFFYFLVFPLFSTSHGKTSRARLPRRRCNYLKHVESRPNVNMETGSFKGWRITPGQVTLLTSQDNHGSTRTRGPPQRVDPPETRPSSHTRPSIQTDYNNTSNIYICIFFFFLNIYLYWKTFSYIAGFRYSPVDF